MTFPTGHFYSPSPNLSELDSTKFRSAFSNMLNLDDPGNLDFSKKAYRSGLAFAKKVKEGRISFNWGNGQFSPADALAYYGVITELKPKRIVEIGSGFSTQIAIHAAKEISPVEITCIEPYPRDFLKDSKDIELLELKTQEVPNQLFESLKSGDILFVDSSHQAKCQSDVLDIFFRVMDLLEVGVHIHFHDIFLPDDYPFFWLKDREIYFNEQYFLLAFLKDNPDYACRLPNANIVRNHTQTFETWISEVKPLFENELSNIEHGFIKAGSFWIEKIQ